MARFGKVRRGVVGHEELGGAVDHGEGGALGVPGGVDCGVAGEEPDFVGEAGEFGDGFGGVGWLGHDGEGLGLVLVSVTWKWIRLWRCRFGNIDHKRDEYA